MNYIAVKDASSHGFRGIIVGEDKACVSTVFRFAWPVDIQDVYCKEVITNPYLECAVMLLMWMIIEEVFSELRAAYLDWWSDNSPM